MRAAMCTLIAAAAATGCLRSTEFKCAQDADCGASGACEADGFCSVPNAGCSGTMRAYGDSAGGLSGSCVPAGQPGLGSDAGVDAGIDGMPPAGCPSGYVQVGGSAHRYKLLSDVSWNEAVTSCHLTSAAAYLAIPDDLSELMNLATVATPPFWVGISRSGPGWMTVQGGTAMYTPWGAGQPDNSPPAKDCVEAISNTQIGTDRCGNHHAAVCECEPGS